jgi:EpsD family peptidyl-prolyl cis-trans isomerase
MRASHKIGIGICALLAAGCEREATGQVAAVVNGEEITLQEINAELANSGVPAEADKEEVQKAALQRIVDRRLMAQAARDDGLDQDPEFLLRRRQLEDALLVQLLGKKLDRTTAVPNDQAIDAYIKEQPALFADRTIFAIDRIQFPMPDDPDRLSVLENDHTMDAIAARLNSMGIQFQRQSAELDSAQLGQQRSNQLSALAEGEPFILPERGIVTVGIGQRPGKPAYRGSRHPQPKHGRRFEGTAGSGKEQGRVQVSVRLRSNHRHSHSHTEDGTTGETVAPAAPPDSRFRLS